jgi:AmiR/NasT family two-component response regulator
LLGGVWWKKPYFWEKKGFFKVNGVQGDFICYKGRKVMDDGDERTTVIVVDDEPITRMDLRESLEIKGYNVVDEASDGMDAVLLCRKHHPDIVFMDIKMPMLDGLSASKIIFKEDLVGTIILLTAYTDSEYIDKATKCGVSGYLVKPIIESSLEPTIAMARAKSSECQRLKKDVQTVSKRLQNRIVIEKAKGCLMEQANIEEKKAYDYLKQISQVGYVDNLIGQSYQNICLIDINLDAIDGKLGFQEAKLGDYYRSIRHIKIWKDKLGFAVVIKDITRERNQEHELVLKSVAIKEIHHRVKNNLQMIASLLRLQGRRTESEETKETFYRQHRRYNCRSFGAGLHTSISHSQYARLPLGSTFP